MTRRVGFVCVAAALLWLGAWIGNLMTAEDTRQWGGFGEGGWRRMINLAIVVFAATIWWLRVTRPLGRVGGVGAWIALASLALLLVGNVLEWGVTGSMWIPYGWGVFIVGGLLGAVGCVTTGVALIRDGGTPTPSRILYGIGTALFLVPLFPVTVGLAWLAWGGALALEPAREPTLAEAT
jgi:hypothetical protein